MSAAKRRFLSSLGRSLTPPTKKLPARPAGPREPRRGSRDGLKLIIDRPLEATTVPVWLEMFLRWFLERFGSQYDLNLGSSWARLGTPWGPKMQYVVKCFDVFAYSLFST